MYEQVQIKSEQKLYISIQTQTARIKFRKMMRQLNVFFNDWFDSLYPNKRIRLAVNILSDLHVLFDFVTQRYL